VIILDLTINFDTTLSTILLLQVLISILCIILGYMFCEFLLAVFF
jgi:hypothetical protein